MAERENKALIEALQEYNKNTPDRGDNCDHHPKSYMNMDFTAGWNARQEQIDTLISLLKDVYLGNEALPKACHPILFPSWLINQFQRRKK